MIVEELESKLGFNLPNRFRTFLKQHPQGYTPTNQHYIIGNVDTMILRFESTVGLWESWLNVREEPEFNNNQMMIIAELLGSDVMTVGTDKTNADSIYYLNWHTGPVLVETSIDALLKTLKQEPSTTG